jgi:hypothetical protein
VFDYCILSSDKTRTVKTTDPAQCDADASLKPLSSPRGVAGAPRAANTLKCQLKPLKAAEYAPAQFSEAQWARLVAVFRAGVCDWSKPGVGQQPAISPTSFAAGPGGRSLAAAHSN